MHKTDLRNNNFYRDDKFYIEVNTDNRWKYTPTPTHLHESFEIYYLLENELQYLINDQIYHMKPGMIAVVHPNVIHATRCLNDDTRKRILINLPIDFFSNILVDSPNLLLDLPHVPFLVNNYDKPTLNFLFNKILKEYNKKNNNWVLIKSYLAQLIIFINEISKKSTLTEHYNSKNNAIKQLLEILDYINGHYNEKLTLEEIAKIFHLNPSYISRALKEKLNVSFTKYLKKVRIKEACNLLATTEKGLSEIVKTTGFYSVSDFCRVFKSVKNLSPLQYRSKYKKDNSF